MSNAVMSANKQRVENATGHISQIIGAVIDVEFEPQDVPEVFHALHLKERDLVLEVQQQLGDGVVRCIAMGSTEGLKRGLAVVNTGQPILVPVGEKTLGRIMNVLGEPIDMAGPIDVETKEPIHRPAPSFLDQAGSTELLETGVKVIDFSEFAVGQKVTGETTKAATLSRSSRTH